MSALLEVEGLVKRFPVGGGAAGWRSMAGRFGIGSAGAPARPMLHAVDGVGFAIGRGETIGLVGESGCGKSTLVRLLTRLIDPTEGSIRFGDTDIGAIPAAQFGRSPDRARLQMVFQDATDSLNPRFTASDAIADPIRRLKPGLGGAALRRRVGELADLVGLPQTLLGRYPHQLSGGQKARVGIARAIAVDPELLILDEPTSALDVSVQVVILRLLEDLKQRLGMSYLFVSHDLNVVRLLCDRVLVMYLGKIVESGPAQAVFEAPAHPYTRALVSAIPTADRERQARRVHLAGEQRSPIDPDPAICRFYGRCPRGADLCRTAMPVLTPLAGEGARAVACHFPEPAPL